MSQSLLPPKFFLPLTGVVFLLIGLSGNATCNAADQSVDKDTAETTKADSDEYPESNKGETSEEESTVSEQAQPTSGSSVFGALGRAIGSMFGGGYEEEEEEISELVGEEAPSFELQSLEDKTVSLESLRGKVVVLDFWATWCGPCMAAMPELQKLHESYQDKPVVVVGINQQEEPADVAEVIEEKGFEFLQLLDTDGTVGNAFKVSGIPQTVLIDTEGVVQAVHVGYSPRIKSVLT